MHEGASVRSGTTGITFKSVMKSALGPYVPMAKETEKERGDEKELLMVPDVGVF